MQQIAQWLSNGWSVVLVVLGLGMIVFLHEFGHFIMAKKNGVRVEIFSLGFALGIPQLILWKYRRGETEYRICAVPLGGYVKMAGETMMDDRKGEPFELTSKTPWQRFQIFVAGALVNLMLAFPIAVLAYVIGKYEVPNEIGRPGAAEERAGILPGDLIQEVGGRPIDSLEKLRIEMIRHPNGTLVPVKLKRGAEIKTVQVESGRSSEHESFPPSLMLVEPVAGSPLREKDVREKDEIASVNGKKVHLREEADALMKQAVDQDVTLQIRRRGVTFEHDEELRDVTIHLPKKTWFIIPLDENFYQPRIAAVRDNTPAAGMLAAGDLIVSIDDKPVLSWSQMRTVVEASAGIPIKVGVQRNDETKTFTITPAKAENGKGRLGVEQDRKLGSVFAEVKPDTFFAKMGVQSGDRLVEIDGHGGNPTLAGVPEEKVPAVVGLREESPRTIEIVVERQGKRIPIKLVAETEVAGDLEKVGFQTVKEGWFRGSLISGGSLVFRRRPLGQAVQVGLTEPVDITVMTIDILKKVVKLQESAKGFSGPLGIAQASYSFAQRSFGNYLWLLCLITVNLGIFNLLPIPILDGGHNVLLLVEVVRKWFGKPPPGEKFIAAFQYVGLAFILSLFVFVTYNDISRLFSPRG